MICQQESPLLVIAGSSCGDRRIELRQDYMVVGREPTCDIWLDDPHVSRTHAALQCRGNTVYITDLGSSGGTFVGNAAVSAPRELHPGDVVSFASVTARFEPASTAALDTVIGLRGVPEAAASAAAARPAVAPATVRPVASPTARPVASPTARPVASPTARPVAAPTARPVAARPEVGRAAWPVAPVAARSVAHGSSQRESARTRSRWLCWTGLIVLVEGCAVAAITRLNVPQPTSGGLAQLRVGPSIAGVPAATLGLALAAVGLVLLLAGLSQRP